MRSPPQSVVLRNVRQHNLKGITVEFPRRALAVITGPSGSGKSSLAFDTLYAEGQRRYIESLSTYAKQFLERMPKPLVDAMEGLSPAVAIEQKNPTTSSRSTVGTATEIADFLRLLWARAGTQTCLQCGREVKRDTVQEVVDAVVAGNGKRETIVAFPLPASAHRPEVEVAAQLRAAGFVRAQVDGTVVRLDEEGAEARVRAGQDVLVIVDRIAAAEENRSRLADAIATAFSEGEGIALALNNGHRRRFSEHPACSACGTAAPVLTPTLFSFNNPRGACPTCNGFGAVLEYDESLIVPAPRRAGPRHWIGRSRAGHPRARAAFFVAQQERPLSRHVSIPRATRGKTLQAVHPCVPAAIPARQDLPGVPGRAPETGIARCSCGGQDDCRRSRADRGRPRALARPAHTAPVSTDRRQSHSE